jgi:hypothetical protein
MPSKVANDVARRRWRRIAALSPAERIQLAEQLGRQGIESFTITQRVDRRTAIARIKATHRLGRRHSTSAAADEY